MQLAIHMTAAKSRNCEQVCLHAHAAQQDKHICRACPKGFIWDYGHLLLLQPCVCQRNWEQLRCKTQLYMQTYVCDRQMSWQSGGACQASGAGCIWRPP